MAKKKLKRKVQIGAAYPSTAGVKSIKGAQKAIRSTIKKIPKAPKEPVTTYYSPTLGKKTTKGPVAGRKLFRKGAEKRTMKKALGKSSENLERARLKEELKLYKKLKKQFGE